jgi:hypothetical protein
MPLSPQTLLVNTSDNILLVKAGVPQNYREQMIKKIEELGDSCDYKTNVKAQMTSYFIWEESPIFDLLLKNIIKIANYYDNVVEQYAIVDCWGALYTKSEYAVPHNHDPAYRSFIYYLTNSNSPLIIEDQTIECKEDTLIYFRSNLIHQVKPTIDEKRICLAGNMIPLEWRLQSNIFKL